MANSGRVQQYKKNKGYESIPREMAQDYELSYGARGLLVDLSSYPSNWKLYKTEVYNRNKYDKEKAISRMWDELVEHGYMLQFRKRDGKRYIYEYVFTTERFGLQDIQLIIDEFLREQYELYLKKSTIDKYKERLNIPLETDTSVIELCTSFWTLQNEESNENVDTTGFLGLRQMETPKGRDKRTIINRDDDDSNNIKNAREQKSELNLIEFLSSANLTQESRKALNLTARLFNEAGFSAESSYKILQRLSEQTELLVPHLIAEQVNWVHKKSQTDSISNLPTYFVNGLSKMVENNTIQSGASFAKEYCDRTTPPEDLEEIPLHNWVQRNE